MASNDSQRAEKAGNGSLPQAFVTGTSSMTKKKLSFRWVIHDAEEFLKQIDEGEFMESPSFWVPLPPNEIYRSQDATSFWCLHICKEDEFYCIYLMLDDSDGETDTVRLSECTSTIVDSETMQTLSVCTSTPLMLSKVKDRKCSKLEYKDLKQFIRNGTLVVQVNGVLTDFVGEIQNEVSIKPESPLYKGLKSLLDDKMFVDLTIKCGDREFGAHKAVLGSQSPVFRRMLETDMKEKVSNVVEILDADPSVVDEMLTYLYTGSAPNVEAMAKDLLVIANKYEISQLLALCEKELKSDISFTTVMDLLVFADQHNSLLLKKACLSYIYHNSSEVHHSSQWKEFKANCHTHAPLLVEIMEYKP